MIRALPLSFRWSFNIKQRKYIPNNSVRIFRGLFITFAHSSMVAPLNINTGNQAPTNLAPLTSLTIAENEVQGTIVGTFQAQDPDGDALTIILPMDSAMGTTRCLPWRRMAR